MEWPPKNLITFLLGSHHASWMYHPASPSEPSPRKKMLKFRDLFKSGVIITEKSQWFWFFYSKMIALRFFFHEQNKNIVGSLVFFWRRKIHCTTKMQVVARRLASLLKKSWGVIAWHRSNRSNRCPNKKVGMGVAKGNLLWEFLKSPLLQVWKINIFRGTYMCAAKKNTLTFHFTACSVRILIICINIPS